MSRLRLVRLLGFGSLALAAVGAGAIAAGGVGGVEAPPGAGASPFDDLSSLEVGLLVFGPAAVLAIGTLVAASRLGKEERRRALLPRIAAWIVLVLPLVPPILFMIAMSTM